MSDTFFYMVSVNSMPSIKSILYAAVSILIVICGFNFYSRKILIEIIPEHFWHKKMICYYGTHLLSLLFMRIFVKSYFG